MATKLCIITKEGCKVYCVYPKAGFMAIFEMEDNPGKWNGAMNYYSLNDDMEELAKDIDRAINNIENLDLY